MYTVAELSEKERAFGINKLVEIMNSNQNNQTMQLRYSGKLSDKKCHDIRSIIKRGVVDWRNWLLCDKAIGANH